VVLGVGGLFRCGVGGGWGNIYSKINCWQKEFLYFFFFFFCFGFSYFLPRSHYRLLWFFFFFLRDFFFHLRAWKKLNKLFTGLGSDFGLGLENAALGLEMFLVLYGRHVGAPPKDTNMASSYKAL